MSNGEEFTLIVDVQASLIAERQEFLPLYVAFLNKGQQRIELARENFILETSDGTRLPLVAYREFNTKYPRHRVDLRIGRNFFEAINGRYPSPPFRKRDIEFYPINESGDVPREMISLAQGELGLGFVYFRLPSDDLLDDVGTARLLFKPAGPGADGQQYVVDIQTYSLKTKR